MRPGTNIVVTDTPLVRAAPTNSGTWFVTGMCEQGPADEAVPIRSMTDYARLLGARVSYGWLYDVLELFFRCGGKLAYVGRVVGPTPVFASHTFQDAAGPTNSLIVKAKSYGTYGNSLLVAILAGDVSGFKIRVSNAGGVLETSGDLPTKADAFIWAQNSNYITLTDSTSANNPAVAGDTALTGGTDDHASATDTQWATALTLFSRDLGPGQVSAPGRTTTIARQQLTAHCNSNSRDAIPDLADTASTATLLAAVSGARDGNERWAGTFAPWLVIPGIVNGAPRTVPPSGAIAAKCAVVNETDGPNVPAAGKKGVLPFVIGLSQPPWTDGTGGQIEQLTLGGVNVIRVMYGQVRIFGWRSNANPATTPLWVPWNSARLVSEIEAKALAIGDDYMFDQIDGAGSMLGSWQGALTAMLLPYYKSNQLFGSTSDEAFVVNVGDPVNTPETEQDGQLNAEIGLRNSPFAEMITITINKQPITQGVV